LVEDGILSVGITSLDAFTAGLEEESWSASFATCKTRFAHTGELDGLELLDFSQNVSLSHVLLELKLLGSWFVETVLIGLVTELSFSSVGGVGSVGSEESELLLLLLVSLLLGLGEDLFDILVKFSPSLSHETSWARSDTFSLLALWVDLEVLAGTALIALALGLTLAAAIVTRITVHGGLVSEGTFWTDTDGESTESLGLLTGHVTRKGAFTFSVSITFGASTTASFLTWLADTSEVNELLNLRVEWLSVREILKSEIGSIKGFSGDWVLLGLSTINTTSKNLSLWRSIPTGEESSISNGGLLSLHLLSGDLTLIEVLLGFKVSFSSLDVVSDSIVGVGITVITLVL